VKAEPPKKIHVEGVGIVTVPTSQTTRSVGFQGPDEFFPDAFGVGYLPLEESDIPLDTTASYGRFEMYDLNHHVFTLFVKDTLEVKLMVDPAGNIEFLFLQGGPKELRALSKRVDQEYNLVMHDLE